MFARTGRNTFAAASRLLWYPSQKKGLPRDFWKWKPLKGDPPSEAVSRRYYRFAMERYHKNKEHKVCKHVLNNSC